MTRLPFAKPRRKPAKQRKPLTRSPVTRGKKVKRFAARRNDAYREWVKTQPCELLGRTPIAWEPLPGWNSCLLEVEFSFGAPHRCHIGDVIDPAHVHTRGHGGDDLGNLLAICHTEHVRQHAQGIQTWTRRWFGGLAEAEQRAEKLAAEYGRITADGEHQP